MKPVSGAISENRRLHEFLHQVQSLKVSKSANYPDCGRNVYGGLSDNITFPGHFDVRAHVHLRRGTGLAGILSVDSFTDACVVAQYKR